jgi:hypothetical protein
MKQIAIVALMFNFGVAGIYGQTGPVNMTLSGSAAASTINLRPDGPTSEYHLAGNGTLGQFDLRTVSVSVPSPQRPSSCAGPTKAYGSAVAGAGVFRFDDGGGLLKVYLTGGSDCIDFSLGEAVCIRIFQISGGTGRFKNASGGTITLTMTVAPVLADASNNPVFFTVTGKITGVVSGVAMDQRSQDWQQ